LDGSTIDLVSNKINSILNLDVSVLMGANIATEVANEFFCEATLGKFCIGFTNNHQKSNFSHGNEKDIVFERTVNYYKNSFKHEIFVWGSSRMYMELKCVDH
jgi:glycerol-3-phosphate dehydrogenase